jgi:large subunit ribosomal protein L22
MEAAVKQRRSVIKREKREAVKLAKKQGAAEAMLKNVPTSPRKMRLVADLIRGVKVNKALSILKFQPQQGAKRLEKLLLSAISNWQSNNQDQRLEEADLVVKEVFVDAGRMLKRLRPAPQGRAYRVRKRSNHVTMVIDSLNAPSPVKTTESVDKEVKSEGGKGKAAKKPAAKATKTASAKKEKTEAKKTKK